MATIEQNLQTLVTAKGDIATAITNKGGTVAEGDGFTSFAEDIASIPAGLADVDYNVNNNKTLRKTEGSTTSNVFVCDDTPTSLSNNPVTSGGVYNTTGDINTILDHILSGTTLITKSISSNGTYNASSDNADGYSSVTVSVPNTYTVSDEGKVVNNGALVAQTSDTTTENGVVDTTLISSLTVNVPSGIEVQPQQSTETSMNPVAKPFLYNFVRKTWNGLTSFEGYNIWTDGDNIYYSSGSTKQYVLDKSTSTWSEKTWNSFKSFNGSYIWTDGDNIYCSTGATSHYVLDKSTSTWSVKTWNGLTIGTGEYIWTDGDNIYYSNDTSQYVLDKSTSTWSEKTWTGLAKPDGRYIWTDGDNIYYSNATRQYVLDKSTSTWSEKTWNGVTSITRSRIWTDGDNIYYSYYSSSSSTSYSHVLDKSTSTWVAQKWNFNIPTGHDIWTDGDNIYCSEPGSQYVLTRIYGPEYTPSIRTTSCKVKFT